MNKLIFAIGLLIGNFSFTHAQCWKELSLFLAIKDDGTMWSFANGDTVQVGSDTDWWKVSAGYDHYLALKTDSTLWGWGNHDHAQLGLGYGNGIPLSYALPTSLGSDHDWVQVSAGTYSSMYLKANGDLYCSGGNNYGQLGIGGTFNQWVIVPVQSIGGNVKNVSTGSNGTFAVKHDGTLWYAGARFFLNENDANNQVTFEQQGTGNDWDTVATGLGHYLLLKTNGELWGGGLNNYGQLGNGTYQHVNGVVQIGTESWSKVVAEMYNSVGLKSNGTLYYWGGNGEISIPVQVGTASDYNNASLLLATRTIGLYGFGNGSAYLLDNCGVNLGFLEPDDSPFRIYPNPVADILLIDGIPEEATIRIFSVGGQEVLSGTRGMQGIDVKNLESGTYLLNLQISDKQHTIRFIKE